MTGLWARNDQQDAECKKFDSHTAKILGHSCICCLPRRSTQQKIPAVIIVACCYSASEMMATLAEFWQEEVWAYPKKHIGGFFDITQGLRGSLRVWYIFTLAAGSVDCCVRLAAKHDAVIPMPPCFLIK